MRRDTIRKLYREAILQVFGCDDKELDSDLVNALKKDILVAHRNTDDGGPILDVYCENGIPNASDIQDFRAEAAEFGIDPSNAVSYNSDKWDDIDGVVNLLLEAMGKHERYHHEPYNTGVVNVYLS